MEKLAIMVGGLNLVVEYMLLMAVDRISGHAAFRWRKVMVSLLVGIHSGLCVLPINELITHTLFRWGLMVGCGLLLYTSRRKMLFRLSLMLLLNFAVEGFQQITGDAGVIPFAGSCLFAAMICVLCFQEGGGKRYLSVELSRNEIHVPITALEDTGNTLRDPVSGEAVLIVSHKVAEKLTGLTCQQLADPVKTMEQPPCSGLRLIPYHSIGCESGMLLAMRFPGSKVGGKEMDLLVAFSPSGLGKEDSFQALAGGVI